MLLLSNCGGALGTATKVTLVTEQGIAASRAQLVTETDRLVTESFERFPGQTEEAHASRLAFYDAGSAPLVPVRDAINVAERLWLGLAHTLDAWEQGASDEGSWQTQVACVVAAVSNIASAMARAGVTLPGLLASATADLEKFAGYMCDASVPGTSAEDHHE